MRAIADDPSGDSSQAASWRRSRRRWRARWGRRAPRSISHAVDALQAIVWTAVRGELADPDPDLISELAERLAQVTEIVRCAALRGGDDLRRDRRVGDEAQAPRDASRGAFGGQPGPQAPRPRAATGALEDAGRVAA